MIRWNDALNIGIGAKRERYVDADELCIDTEIGVPDVISDT